MRRPAHRVLIFCFGLVGLASQEQSRVEFEGRVVDDETGAAVERFVLQQGWAQPGKPESFTWTGWEVNSTRFVDGKFHQSVGWAKGQKVWLRVIADGYAPQPITAAALLVPARATGLVVRLKRGSAVRGQVVDPDGKPVAGAFVALVGPHALNMEGGVAEGFRGSTAYTDRDGRFLLTGIGEDKSEHVAVRSELMAMWIAPVPKVGNELTIRLPGPATLLFRYEIDGDLAEATIRVQLKTWDMPGWEAVQVTERTKLAQKAEATLRNLPPGDYDIARTKSVRVGDMGIGLFLDRRSVSLKSGESHRVDFVRREGHAIVGRLTGLKGVKGAYVFVKPAEATGDPRQMNEYQLTTFDALAADPEGRFKTARIPPGEYTIVAQAWAPEKNEGGLERTGLRLPTLGGRAKVKISADAPPPELTIAMVSQREEKRDEEEGRLPRLLENLGAGELLVREAAHAALVKAACSSAAFYRSLKAILPKARDAEVRGRLSDILAEVARKVPCQIEGRLLWGGTEPGAGERITLTESTDDGNARIATTLTDAEGRFVFEKVPAAVSFQVSRQLDARDEAGKIIDGFVLPVVWIRGEPWSTTRLVLGGRGRPVVGRVALAAGRPGPLDHAQTAVAVDLAAPPLSVRVDGWGKAYGEFRKSQQGIHYRRAGVTVLPDGSFRIDWLPAARYSLVVHGPQGSVTHTFEVPTTSEGESDEPLSLGPLELRPAKGPEDK